MATTIVPGTAIQKIVDVSIKNAKTFSEKVFFLELWPIDKATEKTIEVKGEGKKLTSAFELIQFKFDKNNNFIYTSSDVNQKATYAGTASEFSISGFSAGAVVRIGKTNSTSDAIEQYRGPAESVDVRVELISKPEEGLWTSVAWNTKPRTYTQDGIDDEIDARIHYRGGNTRKFQISGDTQSTCIVTGDAPRIFVKGNPRWQNVEMKVDVEKDAGVSTVSLRSRSNHRDDCGLCGYVVSFHAPDGEVAIKKEGLHPLYTDRIITKPFTMKTGWNTLSTKTYNMDDTVKIEGYVNGTKVIETTDKGQWSNWNFDPQEDQPTLDECNQTLEKLQKPQLEPANHCYLRMDDSNNVKIRNVTITELPP